MTWEEAVKTMGKWYQENIHSYWGGGGRRGEAASSSPLYVGMAGQRGSFKCDLLNRNVQNDCTAFIGACCQLFKPDIFGPNFAPGSAQLADKNGDTARKMQQAGFQILDWSESAMQPGDIISGHTCFGTKGHHGEIYDGNRKSWSWGAVHDGKNGRAGMPSGYSGPPGHTYGLIYRYPGGWTGQASAGTFSATGGMTGGGMAGAGTWAGDFDQAAAAADASRGKKIFSRTTAQTNMLSLFLTGEDSSAMTDTDLFKTPPRIWQFFPPSIVMPTISFPVSPFEDEPALLDASLGERLKKSVKEKLDKETKAREEKDKKEKNNPKDIAADENKKTEEGENGKKNEDKSGENSELDPTRGTGKQAKETHEKFAGDEPGLGYKEVQAPYAVEKDLKKDLGRSYPIIYINDHIFSEDEIEYFKLDCMGFLPTLELHIRSTSKNMLKENLPKEGDTVGVFIQYTHTLIRPLRCDFQITAAITKEISQEHQQEFFSMIVYGELKIPDLYNSDIAFEYQGSSRNALIDIAQKLKLGYCFNDPEDTRDAQSWYCTPEQSGDPATYIEDLATHLYKDSSSFYGAWIDPRYNLTVINIRDMLGTTIDCDDGIDLTKMVSVINNNFFDGGRQDKNKSVLTPKLFNNFLGDQATDTYYVYDYKLVNQASEISNKMGLLQHSNFGINATGLPSSLTIEINPQLCLNWEKIEGVTAKGEPTDARYIALVGPGINRNQNDNPPENGNYTQSKTKTSAATDINVQSDEDMEAAKNAESNQIKIASQEDFLNTPSTAIELKEIIFTPQKSTTDTSVNIEDSSVQSVWEKTAFQLIDYINQLDLTSQNISEDAPCMDIGLE